MDVTGLRANWMPTLFGFLGTVLVYFSQLGANFPTTKDEWVTAGAAATLTGLGLTAKQYNVTNSPAPVQPQAVQATTLPPPPTI